MLLLFKVVVLCATGFVVICEGILVVVDWGVKEWAGEGEEESVLVVVWCVPVLFVLAAKENVPNAVTDTRTIAIVMMTMMIVVFVFVRSHQKRAWMYLLCNENPSTLYRNIILYTTCKTLWTSWREHY